jgi:hypothetical protein
MRPLESGRGGFWLEFKLGLEQDRKGSEFQVRSWDRMWILQGRGGVGTHFKNQRNCICSSRQGEFGRIAGRIELIKHAYAHTITNTDPGVNSISLFSQDLGISLDSGSGPDLNEWRDSA